MSLSLQSNATAEALYAKWGEAPGQMFQYTAAFICGTSERTDTKLIQGDYRTEILLHNPYMRRLQVRIEIALAFPPGEGLSGEISPARVLTLDPRASLEIDCGDIFGHEGRSSRFFDPPFPWGGDCCYDQPCTFIKGFVVIESPLQIDVRGILSAAPENERVTSVEIGIIPFQILLDLA